MKKEQIDFCRKYNITEEQFYGKEEIGGRLDLSSATSIPVGFNPTVGGNLDLDSVISIPDSFNPIVGGYLDLSSATSIPVGFNPTVGGNLDLDSVISIPDSFNPIVGGYLDLSSVTSLPDSFNPIVGGNLNLRSVTSLPDSFNPIVGGSLDLDSVISIPDSFNPIVGGYLDLSSATSIPDSFNPTVGGRLDLSSATSIPVGFNPTVGGNLYLRSGLSCEINKIPKGFIFSWLGGKYIRIDGILSEVISKKNNVLKVKNVGSTKISYIVSNGTHFSHGDSIKQARDSLIYKISDRDRTKYNSLTIDSILPIAKAIECYRVITGACESGTKAFVTSANKLKKEYSIKEIIDLTQGQYGDEEFKKFFNK